MSSDTSVTIRLNSKDNVVTAKETIPPKTELSREAMTTTMELPVGHKVATPTIKQGAPHGQLAVRHVF